MRFGQVQGMRRNTLRRILGEPEFDLHLELHRGLHGQPPPAGKPRLPVGGEGRLAANRSHPAGTAGHRRRPDRPGHSPGERKSGRFKKPAYDLQLNGDAGTREELLERVMRL
ncbi:MAG: hypothetical protein U1F77_08540 [Kiritimatiellia bacterium]